MTNSRILIFSAGVNCKKYIEKHMKSIQKQDYKDYIHVIVDDASNDGTYDEIMKYANEKTFVYRNSVNVGWIKNAVDYLEKHIESPDDIILLVDLDDWLSADKAMLKILDVYNRTLCWATYGSFVRSTGDIKEIDQKGFLDTRYGNKFWDKKQFRDSKKTWRYWAPRTFKAFLWMEINPEDFKGPDGEFPYSCYDRAIGYPILEMCPADKCQHIKDILYVYNVDNPLNDFKIREHEQSMLVEWYGSNDSYDTLTDKYIQQKYFEYVDTDMEEDDMETIVRGAGNHFVIFACGYNCEKYVAKHMKSVQKQTYQNFTHVIVDDCSTDGTYDEIMKYADDKTIVIRNEENKKWLRNSVEHLSKLLEPEDIIVIVDLDDWFAAPGVLELMDSIYTKEDCWITYGRFVDSRDDKAKPLPMNGMRRSVSDRRNFRNSEWVYLHPQSFKAFLFLVINPNDFKGPNGEYAPCSYDRAVMYPILEMTPSTKIRYIKNILYVYNSENVLSVVKVMSEKQLFYEKWFRSLPSYKMLKGKPVI